MLFAELAQEATIQTAILGFLLLFLTIAQSWWQLKKAEWDKISSKKELDSAAQKAMNTAEAAAKTAEATNNKLDTVYEAVNGSGLMGAISQLDKKIEMTNEALITHAKEDSNWRSKIVQQLGALDTLIRGVKKPVHEERI